MRTALRRIDIIYKTVKHFVVAIIMLESHFHIHIIPLALEIQDFFIKRCLVII